MEEMFIRVRWSNRTFGVPLDQLEGIDPGKEAQQAIADWKYWNG